MAWRFALLSLCLMAPVSVAAAGISMHLDRQEMSQQDTLTLQVVVEGSQNAVANLPDLGAFEVRQGGRSSQMQVVNGHISTSVVSTYYLSPRRPGRFTLTPASVNIDGQNYHSEPLAVVVKSAASAPSAASEQAPLFANAELSNNAPYLGQQLIYTWRLYRRSALRLANPGLTLPRFEGFAVEALGDEREYETHLHGQVYLVTEVRKALFPQDAATQAVDGSLLQVDVLGAGRRSATEPGFGSPFDDFFGRSAQQRRQLRTPPLSLTIRPLPAAPAGFSGLVGETQLTASLSHPKVQVGDACTLTVSLSSSGNPQHLLEPSMAPLASLKAYDDRPSDGRTPRSAGLMSSRVFKKALVPTAAGELTLPPLSVVYFDPIAHTYRTARSEPLTLVASGGHGPAATADEAPPPLAAAARPGIAVLADDIMAPHRSARALRSGQLSAGARRCLQLGLWLPPLLYLGLRLLQRRGAGGHRGQRRTALKRGLAAADLLSQASDSAASAAQASRALRVYLGLLLNTQGLALTPVEARGQLAARGVRANLAAAVEAWLSRCEAMQYALQAPPQKGVLASEMRTLLRQLDMGVR